jgi:hypothetical protein
MTDLHPNHGHGTPGDRAGFEREDLGSKPVFAFIISVVVIGLLVYYAIWGMFRLLDVYEAKEQKSVSPLVQIQQANPRDVRANIANTFPEPRLEENERTEINDVRYAEEEQLNSAGWVDQSAGVAHIPITRAMQLIAERGLPTKPQAGTAPSSPVNMSREAANKTDTSNAPKTPSQKQGKSQ